MGEDQAGWSGSDDADLGAEAPGHSHFTLHHLVEGACGVAKAEDKTLYGIIPSRV